jgi:AcrR family transcriptional regulator
VNVIASGSALATEAQTPSAKSKTSAIAPVARIILRPTAASSPDPLSPGIIEVLSPLTWSRYTVSSSRDYGSSVQKAKPSGAQAKKRRQLSPDVITKAAIRLADAEGLEAVSIRRVAAELDARAMSLYDHFASKQDLLVSMVDEKVGEMLASQPLPNEWREAVAVSARKMYAAYAHHPWMLFVAVERARPGPNGVTLAKQMARALANLPLEHEDVWQVQGIVNDYVIGYSFRTVGTVNPEDMEAAIAASDLVEFPELAALPDSLRTRSSIDRFELGLQTVLDGIERRFLDQPG